MYKYRISVYKFVTIKNFIIEKIDIFRRTNIIQYI